MNETEEFWRGEFGDLYASRNDGEKLVKSKEWLFRRALSSTFHTSPQRVIEFGANIGLNLRVISRIDAYAMCEFSAVEINSAACEQLRQINGLNVYEASLLRPDPIWGNGYDLSLSAGVLIHVNPSDLPAAYAALYNSSKRNILVAEYHSHTPVEVEYRGHVGRLWKRDFAAEMLDRYPDLKVKDYGFAWSRCPNAPLDDVFWALLSKG